MAPPAPFLRHSFQRALRRLGFEVGFELIRDGFFPAGGGKLAMRVKPARPEELRRLDWVGRGRFMSLRCEVIYAHLPTHVARREMEVLRQSLQSAGWPLPAVTVREAEESKGPGNAVSVRAIYEEAEEVFTGIGQRGKRAETVAKEAADASLRWLMAGVPVGPHLADQLLLPLALAKGGRFATLAPLDAHVPTNAEVISRLTGASTRFTNHGERVIVEVEPA
jgi:RNA 3'-terminal phosphate cyclase (ATP)